MTTQVYLVVENVYAEISGGCCGHETETDYTQVSYHILGLYFSLEGAQQALQDQFDRSTELYYRMGHYKNLPPSGLEIRQMSTNSVLSNEDSTEFVCGDGSVTTLTLDQWLLRNPENRKTYQTHMEQRERESAILTRQHQLTQTLSKHNIATRNDSKLSQVYIKDGIEGLQTLTHGKVTTYEQFIEKLIFANFLHQYTNYRKITRIANTEERKIEAIKQYVHKHPQLEHVNSLIKPQIDKIIKNLPKPKGIVNRLMDTFFSDLNSVSMNASNRYKK